VKFADVMGVLREMAVKEGHCPKERISEMEELDKFAQDLRCNMVKYLLKPNKKQGDVIMAMVEKKIKIGK